MQVLGREMRKEEKGKLRPERKGFLKMGNKLCRGSIFKQVSNNLKKPGTMHALFHLIPTTLYKGILILILQLRKSVEAQKS